MEGLNLEVPFLKHKLDDQPLYYSPLLTIASNTQYYDNGHEIFTIDFQIQ